MAKNSEKSNNPKKTMDYSEEDMSETEEYFQEASATNTKYKNLRKPTKTTGSQ
jgi:hypothetical protein